MRVMTGALAAAVAGEVTALALCWRVVRRDGVALGFTSHDRALVVDGMVFRPAPGMVPSAIRASDGFDVDVMEVAGALTSDAIRADDLAAGRFDGARVTVLLVDWEQPEAGSVLLARGVMGAVERVDGAFTAELRGAGHGLDAVPVELTSPDCRAVLGDRRCRVDLAGQTRLARVMAVVDALTVETDAAAAFGGAVADGDFAYGRLRVLDGAAAAADAEIAASAGGRMTLRTAVPGGLAAGAESEALSFSINGTLNAVMVTTFRTLLSDISKFNSLSLPAKT